MDARVQQMFDGSVLAFVFRFWVLEHALLPITTYAISQHSRLDSLRHSAGIVPAKTPCLHTASLTALSSLSCEPMFRLRSSCTDRARDAYGGMVTQGDFPIPSSPRCSVADDLLSPESSITLRSCSAQCPALHSIFARSPCWVMHSAVSKNTWRGELYGRVIRSEIDEQCSAPSPTRAS